MTDDYGNPAMDFDGAQDELVAPYDASMLASSGLSVYMVFSVPGGVSSSSIEYLAGRMAEDKRCWAVASWTSAGLPRLQIGTTNGESATSVRATEGYDESATNIVAWDHDPAEAVILVGSVALATAGSPVAAFNQEDAPLTIGGDGILNGESRVSELVFYPALKSFQQSEIATTLGQYLGIPE